MWAEKVQKWRHHSKAESLGQSSEVKGEDGVGGTGRGAGGNPEVCFRQASLR